MRARDSAGPEEGGAEGEDERALSLVQEASVRLPARGARHEAIVPYPGGGGTW
jgi:hypothetical protein